jgi:gamma-glutamylcyclotransferase (GGCT)/AIG2-like uncharacterized protein YtfP
MACCDVLFVYGTLMSCATGRLGRAERARLYREGRSLGPAWTAGRLYDLGRFPGMTEPRDPGEIVHGEAVRLADARSTLAWLDAYEGIGAGGGHDEYARVERPVCLASGGELNAALYLYRGDVGRARRLPGGRWPAAGEPSGS